MDLTTKHVTTIAISKIVISLSPPLSKYKTDKNDCCPCVVERVFNQNYCLEFSQNQTTSVVAKPIQILHLSVSRDRLGKKMWTPKNRLGKIFEHWLHRDSLGFKENSKSLSIKPRVCCEGAKGWNWWLGDWNFKLVLVAETQHGALLLLLVNFRINFNWNLELKFRIGPGRWDTAWCTTPALWL